MTEEVQLQHNPKMAAEFVAQQGQWLREAKAKAKRALWDEGLEFYSEEMAYQYQTLRDDLRMTCGEPGSAKTIENLAEQMAMVRLEDSEQYWEDKTDRMNSEANEYGIDLREEQENQAALAGQTYGEASHGI